MTEPVVAIVVPVFNGAVHLGECLESVLGQTYGHWRAVVLNNCSSDRTGEIADDFARRDRRIRIVHATDFVPQNENYNRALAQADAEARYIKVLEGDNWIAPECLAQTVRLAEREPTIGVVGSYALVGRRLSGGGLDHGEQVLTGVDVVRRLYRDQTYVFGAPTNLLFRAEALRQEAAWFRADVCCDDADLCLRLLRKWNFGYVHQVLAFIRVADAGAYAAIREFDHRPAWMYFAIQAYGADYFTEPELTEVRRVAEWRYFNCLSQALLLGQSPAYWKFHRRWFDAAGRKFPTSQLWWPALRNLIRLGLNPLSTWELLAQRRRLRRRLNGHPT